MLTFSDNILSGVTDEIFPDITTDAGACLSGSLIYLIMQQQML